MVFILTGAKPIAANAAKPYRVRNRLIGAAVLLGLIAVPLAWHGLQTARTRCWRRALLPSSPPGSEIGTSPSSTGRSTARTSPAPHRPGVHREAPTAWPGTSRRLFGTPVDLRVEYVPTQVFVVTADP